MVLRIVTDGNIVAGLCLTADRLQLPHYHTHERCLSLSVASDESDFLSPSDLNLSIPENNLLRIAYSQVLSLEHYVTGTRSRRELDCQRHIICLVNLHSVKLFKLLDS